MFYAIPLESKPTWRNPPWLTLLLILVNVAIFFGPQRTQEKAEQRATAYYLSTPLADWELPPFVTHLEQTGSRFAKQAREVLRRGEQRGELVQLMHTERKFETRLRADKVILADDPRHDEWKALRADYERMLPAPFTDRWSLDFADGAAPQPLTWLTSAFLHASASHLIGNMVFLFLFGFTVELALGRATYLGFYVLGALGASAMAMWAYGGRGGYGLGASGAIAALMAMYALIYKLRRIRFFYQFFFYFNYITAPALILLPIWMVNEFVQHVTGHTGVGYMTHLGGLLTGTLLMLLWPAARRSKPVVAPVAPPDPFHDHVERATQFSARLQFDRAAVEWAAAARLRPEDQPTLRAFFNTARLHPSSNAFHRAAKQIFRLKDGSEAAVEFQHESYKVYLDQAKPSVRLKPRDMGRLAVRFARGGHMDDARRLCQALLSSAPDDGATVEALTMVASCEWHAGQREQALNWLPQLQKLAPAHPVTRMLVA
ncbi:rhomboid family intramembrane serine protease [Variovorax sp. dw_954]|uniref:rhomboid family intramembrane serine protease n=1 Tax=Variovorax sp. dw_954 TaxID=2720078 RepID=UPI001BD39C7B